VTGPAVLLQSPWLGQSWSLTDAAVVLGFTAGATALSVLTFRWE
jgi:hypothetical protein